MTPAGSSAERGSATVWVLAFSAVLATIGLAVVLVGAAVVARHRATAAADLAALAGAVRAVRGDADPCATAATVAAANSAQLLSCSVGDDAVVEVRVGVPVRLGRLGVHEATGRARAGPVPPGAGEASVGDVSAFEPGEFVEDDVEDPDGAGLVEGIVAVAALG